MTGPRQQAPATSPDSAPETANATLRLDESLACLDRERPTGTVAAVGVLSPWPEMTPLLREVTTGTPGRNRAHRQPASLDLHRELPGAPVPRDGELRDFRVTDQAIRGATARSSAATHNSAKAGHHS
jgi:hypothetical protein